MVRSKHSQRWNDLAVGNEGSEVQLYGFRTSQNKDVSSMKKVWISQFTEYNPQQVCNFQVLSCSIAISNSLFSSTSWNTNIKVSVYEHGWIYDGNLIENLCL